MSLTNPASSPGSRPLWAGRVAVLLGIVLLALSLRSAVAALSPILSLVSRDVPLGPVLLGVIGAAPPVAFALSGIVAPMVSRRVGVEKALLFAVIAMAAGQLVRAVAPNASLLLVGTALTLIGAGIGNVLLPPVVKRYFPDRITQVTTFYAVLISVSVALPALAAVPVASAWGWRASLGVWFLVALTAIAPWIVVARASGAGSASTSALAAEGIRPQSGRLFRSPVAWAITVVFAVSTINAYGMFAWLPTLLVDTAHVSPAAAGSLLALYAIIGFPASLLVPAIAARIRNVGLLVYLAVGLFVIGNGGLLLAPAAAPILWVVIAGLGPMLFPLALVLITTRTRTHAGSIALSGFVQGFGYIIGAASPLSVGLLHQVTGHWSGSMTLLLVVSLAAIPAGILLARPRYLEDGWDHSGRPGDDGVGQRGDSGHQFGTVDEGSSTDERSVPG
jgi:CP family cyanate transporter-like MFS transporter